MRGAMLTTAAATAVFGLMAPHPSAAVTAAAAATSCQQDGVAMLCVTPTSTQDVLSLDYQVTQSDGPGTYSVYAVRTDTGVASSAQSVGPLGYQEVGSGTIHAALGGCYDVHLDGVPGESVVVGSVCG